MLSEEFSGYRIAHISDLHNATLSKDNKKLLSLLKESEPDIIAITGDLIDARNTDFKTALHFVGEAVKIAPCYYVTGNHEARIPEYTQFREELSALGVDILDDERTQIVRQDKKITLIGMNDPSFKADYISNDERSVIRDSLAELTDESNGFTVLLSHRPEMFDIYADSGVNVVLCGHAHGGQFRLPFVGGMFAPSQGFFPEYDSGLYTEGNTGMLVSRGIGNSLFPFRVNNRPEIILLVLQSKDSI